MGWFIIAGIGVTLFVLLAFICGIKDALLSVYYSLKYVLFKAIEILVRIIAAFLQTLSDFVFWFCWIVVSLFGFLAIPNQLMLMGVIDLIFLIVLIKKMIPNLKDWGRKLLVQKWMALIERPLCFKNKDLTCYPQYWI